MWFRNERCWHLVRRCLQHRSGRLLNYWQTRWQHWRFHCVSNCGTVCRTRCSHTWRWRVVNQHGVVHIQSLSMLFCCHRFAAIAFRVVIGWVWWHFVVEKYVCTNPILIVQIQIGRILNVFDGIIRRKGVFWWRCRISRFWCGTCMYLTQTSLYSIWSSAPQICLLRRRRQWWCVNLGTIQISHLIFDNDRWRCFVQMPRPVSR